MDARLAISAGVGVILAVSVAAQAAPPDIAEGHRLALLVCANCHVVERDQAREPILNPPALSFEQIAGRAGETEAGVATYLATSHQTIASPNGMPNPQLLENQRRNVAAYLMSLRRH